MLRSGIKNEYDDLYNFFSSELGHAINRGSVEIDELTSKKKKQKEQKIIKILPQVSKFMWILVPVIWAGQNIAPPPFKNRNDVIALSNMRKTVGKTR